MSMIKWNIYFNSINTYRVGMLDFYLVHYVSHNFFTYLTKFSWSGTRFLSQYTISKSNMKWDKTMRMKKAIVLIVAIDSEMYQLEL